MKPQDITDSLGTMDDGFLTEVDELRTRKERETDTVQNNPKKFLLPFAATLLVLVVFGGVAYAMNGFSWDFHFTKADSTNQSSFDDETSGYQVSIDPIVSRIPLKEIKGKVTEAKKRIPEQFANTTPLSSYYPGHFCKSFDSVEDALTYIGYQGLKQPKLEEMPGNVEVNVLGSKEGSLYQISLDVSCLSNSGYSKGFSAKLHYSSSTLLYLENADEDQPLEPAIRTDYGTTRIDEHGNTVLDHTSAQNISYETKVVNHREFLVISVPTDSDGRAMIDVIWQENRAIYTLHLAFLEECQSDAETLMLAWMNQF